MATVVLSVLGNDRPGLVDALSSVIAEHRGSWDQSQLSRLAGKFAGIVVVSIADDDVAGLLDGLDPIRSNGLLDVHASIAEPEPAEGAATHDVEMHLIGADRPGIMHEIAAALAANDVSIVELTTSTVSAPMAGELLFEAALSLSVPVELATDVLRDSLEELAAELMVDLEFQDIDMGVDAD